MSGLAVSMTRAGIARDGHLYRERPALGLHEPRPSQVPGLSQVELILMNPLSRTGSDGPGLAPTVHCERAIHARSTLTQMGAIC